MLQVPGGVDHNGLPRMPYAPMRDIVFIYPQMLQSIVKAFNSSYWPELVKTVAKALSVDEDAAFDLLCKANDAYFQFVMRCCENPEETYDDVMRRCGWHDLPHEVRFGFMAMLGCVASGQLFSGLRDVSLAGDSPSPYVKSLLEFRAAEGRRTENDIPTEKELALEFKTLVHSCVQGGFRISELEKMLSDVKTE